MINGNLGGNESALVTVSRELSLVKQMFTKPIEWGKLKNNQVNMEPL